MAVNLTGKWHCFGEGLQKNEIDIPGTVNEAGIGLEITKDTEWISGLHNPFWFEREEYKSGTEEDFHVPFLSQPRTHYNGVVRYSRDFAIDNAGDYYLFIEISKWKLEAFIDGESIGVKETLCAPFVFGPVRLEKGKHSIAVSVDNRMQHKYRPDAHTVSDALGANFNGMCGKIELISSREYETILEERKEYCGKHPFSVTTDGNNVVVNGKATYLRGTHFGGDFPLTGYPVTDYSYWAKIMQIVKDYGFNFIRCHSFCPPECAFLAADDYGVLFQIECGMWNTFNPENSTMYDILISETENILKAFGHHPSFAFMSPSNEPGGNWYGTLRKWVSDAKEINRKLGYEGRRLFTAQSGWFFDVPPKEVTGTDYMYFHRSAYGPIHGGMIRNRWGFNGRDYSPSVEGAKIPVIAHEMGQWCAYPDFDVIDEYTGCLRPGNFEIFRKTAEQNGVLQYNKDFVYCSGRNQVRFLKEEFEANRRTPEITGFEYLDLHDYSGQGTAVVGVLDTFWRNKGYVTPEEFRQFNADTVILTRIRSYVLTNKDTLSTPVEISNFSGKALKNAVLDWNLSDENGNLKASGQLKSEMIPCGINTVIGQIDVYLGFAFETEGLCLNLKLSDESGEVSKNSWNITVFVKDTENYLEKSGAVWCRTLPEAEKMLSEGQTVIFSPYLSDLDLDCPSLSIKNVYWNAQMGPRWERNLGICADTASPLMKYFPTGKSGGWQWESIFDRARCFNFPAKYKAIVRPVDEWNRNFPLSLIFEGKVLNGKLLFISADLSGEFEENPAVYSLRKAIERYVSSGDFNPLQVISLEDLRRHLKPLYKGSDIIREVLVNGEKPAYSINISDINPNYPFVIHSGKLPVEFEISLRKKVNVKSLYILPIQNDRDFPGVIKDYEVSAEGKTVSGTLRNAFETQQTGEIDVLTDKIVLKVKSTYSMGTASRWIENAEGYEKLTAVEPLSVSLAVLGVDFEDDSFAVFRTDEPFWRGSAESRHREIDTGD